MKATVSKVQPDRLDPAAADTESPASLDSIGGNIIGKPETVECLQGSFPEEHNGACCPHLELLDGLQQENRRLKRANDILRNVASYLEHTRNKYGSI